MPPSIPATRIRPRTPLEEKRSEIYGSILGILHKEETRLNEVLDRLIQDNQALGGTLGAYRLQGDLFTRMPIRHFAGVDVKPPHPELLDRALYHRDAEKRLQEGFHTLRLSLSVVTHHCSSFQALRDTLPETLVAFVPSLAEIPRLRPEGWFRREKAALVSAVERIDEITGYYLANQLIF